MGDLTDAELAKLEKSGARAFTRATVLRLVAEVKRRRAEQPKGKKHELTLEEKVGTEEK